MILTCSYLEEGFPGLPRSTATLPDDAVIHSEIDHAILIHLGPDVDIGLFGFILHLSYRSVVIDLQQYFRGGLQGLPVS